MDGLRAIAVLSVISYHAGLSFLSGGYGGVDIFFVISGFLLGGIILREKSDGDFSYRRFYGRRIRRIFPALLVMILVTLPFAWWLMIPDQLRYFGGAALTALLSLSNIWFYDRIDYFNPDAANDPLIHTWSLGVEEQFYLLLPLLLSALLMLGRRALAPALGLIALCSFVWTVYSNNDLQKEAFYLLHTRLWEFLVGVLIAHYQPQFSKVGKSLQASLACLGLGVILVGLVFTPKLVAWPGYWTLLPVLGSALLLAFGNAPSPARWLLSRRPMIWVGLISYSAYLWHQPALSFLKMEGMQPSSVLQIAAFVALILAVAYLSWRWIEEPFRRERIALWPKRVILWGSAGLITVFAVGGHVTEGYVQRVPEHIRFLTEVDLQRPVGFMNCIETRRDEGFTRAIDDYCVHGEGQPKIAIWGDSHVGSIARPFGEAMIGSGVALREISTSSCHPIPGLINVSQRRADQCPLQAQRVEDWLVQSDTEVVVLYAYWNSYIQYADYDNHLGQVEADGFYAVPYPEQGALDEEQRHDAIQKALQVSLKRLVDAGIKPLVVMPLPAPSFNPLDMMLRGYWKSGELPEHAAMPQAAFDHYSAPARRILQAACDESGAQCLELSGLICDGAQCDIIAKGRPIYYDGNHLALAGAERLVGPLAKAALNLMKP